MLNKKLLLWTFCIDRGFACEWLVGVDKAQRCVTDFTHLNYTDKLIFLMNYINLTHILDSTIYDMFTRPKQSVS